MALPALDPGSSGWRARFRVLTKKDNPLRLRVHDSLRGIDCFYDFQSHEQLRHHVNQLRAGYTDLAPDGILSPGSHTRA